MTEEKVVRGSPFIDPDKWLRAWLKDKQPEAHEALMSESSVVGFSALVAWVAKNLDETSLKNLDNDSWMAEGLRVAHSEELSDAVEARLNPKEEVA